MCFHFCYITLKYIFKGQDSTKWMIFTALQKAVSSITSRWVHGGVNTHSLLVPVLPSQVALNHQPPTHCCRCNRANVNTVEEPGWQDCVKTADDVRPTDVTGLLESTRGLADPQPHLHCCSSTAAQWLLCWTNFLSLVGMLQCSKVGPRKGNAWFSLFIKEKQALQTLNILLQSAFMWLTA